jgi:hypothetical protein
MPPRPPLRAASLVENRAAYTQPVGRVPGVGLKCRTGVPGAKRWVGPAGPPHRGAHGGIAVWRNPPTGSISGVTS